MKEAREKGARPTEAADDENTKPQRHGAACQGLLLLLVVVDIVFEKAGP